MVNRNLSLLTKTVWLMASNTETKCCRFTGSSPTIGSIYCYSVIKKWIPISVDSYSNKEEAENSEKESTRTQSELV